MADKQSKLLVENWRAFINEEQPVANPEKEAADALKTITNVFAQQVKANANSIEADVAADKTDSAKQGTPVEEAALLGAVGATLAIPRILSLISTVVKSLGKAFGAKMNDKNFLDTLASDIHHQYEGAIKLGLKLIPSFRKLDESKQDKVAKHVLNAIIASLMLSSTAGAAAAAAGGQTGFAALEGALAAVKAGELSKYLETAFT